MKVLLTGGAGFIGYHLVTTLLARSDIERVGVIDNLDPYYDPIVKQQRLQQWEEVPNFTFFPVDIRDDMKMEPIFQSADWDVVIHLAAIPGVRTSLHRATEYVDVDVTGTVQLLQWMVKYEVPQLIFFSSSSVYGEQQEVKPWREGDTIEQPNNPYAAAKWSAEIFCRTYQQLYGLAVTVLRPFTVYGPEQRPDMAIRHFAEQLLQKRTLPVFALDSFRDYTYVEDIVQAVQLSLLAPSGYRLFNVASGERITLRQMIYALADSLQIQPELEIIGEQLGDLSYTWADLTHVRKELGYEPQVSFVEGIQRFAAWFRREAEKR